MPDNNFINEDQIPENWEPAEVGPKGAAAPPIPHDMPQFFSGSLPPQFQHDVAFVGTEHRSPRVPVHSLMPLGIQANPSTNAAIQSTATKVVEANPTPPSTGGGASTVELQMPNIFTPTDQTVTLPGPLVVGLATENPGTFLAAPPAGGGLSGLEASIQGSTFTGGGSTGTNTLTATPPASASSWGLYVDNYNNTVVVPSGWSQFTGSTSQQSGMYKSLSGATPVTVSQPVALSSTASGFLAIFNGALPTIIKQASGAWAGVPNFTATFAGGNVAGNTIILIVMGLAPSGFQPSLSVKDSAGNVYTTLNFQQQAGVWSMSTMVLIAANCVGGANVVTVTMTNTTGGAAGLVQAIEMAPFAAGSGIPFFRNIFPSDVPPINLNSTGNGGISGQLGVAHGGTGADLSATGGAHKFAAQVTAGAVFTVIQPDFPDLAGAAAKLATSYNGVALVSNGLPSEIATVDLTAQAAAIVPTNLVASTSQAGMYRISWVAKVTTPGTTSVLGGTNGFQITYTDANDSVVVVTPAWWDGGNNGAAPASASLNTTQTYIGGSMTINAKIATAIKYAIDYTSSGTAMNYNLHIKLEAL